MRKRRVGPAGRTGDNFKIAPKDICSLAENFLGLVRLVVKLRKNFNV